MNQLLMQSEISQLRRQVQAMAMEREQYVRLTICLANLIRGKQEAKIVDGQVAVDLPAYVAVPSKWQIGLEQKNVRAADAAEDDKGEDVIVVQVTAKMPATNGHVLAPKQPSGILLP